MLQVNDWNYKHGTDLSPKAGEIPPQDCPRASLVKQKFGVLRVHIERRSRLPKSIDMDFANAVRRPNEICETCGGQGSLRKTAWPHVACERSEQINVNASSDARSSDAEFEEHFKALKILLANRGRE